MPQINKWQRKWTQTCKGKTTKEYFPDVAERLKMKLQLTHNFTAIITGHGKTRAYLQRFKIIKEPTCPCGKGAQTTDHLIYTCEVLTKERDRLKKTTLRENRWPISKMEVIRRYYKEFTNFINKIEFDILEKPNKCTISTKIIVKLVVLPNNCIISAKIIVKL